jgi:hypothetical protein
MSESVCIQSRRMLRLTIKAFNLLHCVFIVCCVPFAGFAGPAESFFGVELDAQANFTVHRLSAVLIGLHMAAIIAHMGMMSSGSERRQSWLFPSRVRKAWVWPVRLGCGAVTCVHEQASSLLQIRTSGST